MQPNRPATHNPAPTTLREQRLWQIARARTKFQGHLFTYLIINAGLWLLWALAPGAHERHELPWPVWTSLFWGIGLALQGVAVYSRLNCGERTQREYERLLAQDN
ncbi:2TM domain-containing protein [Hymenobacter sp. BRD67]|uniref:2TM domain-containing protein n=1 Tax=Hymenobacter sp. BRD67 TaxID=2675877 RepID=UPI0015656226|nr:2TM domain-containing protein [Hymenobacter sp. BRD67]QKG51562.1 2TM domain-containing protein [Hymenobacter sp. BRD67]